MPSETSQSSHATQTPPGAYSVVVAPPSVEIDPGEPIQLGIYLIGEGAITANQLDVIHRNPALTAHERGTVTVRAEPLVREHIVAGETVEANFDTGHDLDQTGAKLSFPEELFTTAKGHPEKFDFPVTYLDTDHDGEPPIQYTLPTAADTPKGTYELTLVFTYQSGEEIRQDRTQVPVQVRSYRQRKEPLPTIATILAALIALVSLGLTAIDTLPV